MEKLTHIQPNELTSTGPIFCTVDLMTYLSYNDAMMMSHSCPLLCFNDFDLHKVSILTVILFRFLLHEGVHTNSSRFRTLAPSHKMYPTAIECHSDQDLARNNRDADGAHKRLSNCVVKTCFTHSAFFSKNQRLKSKE